MPAMGAVRAVNSDLIARPYLTGEINVSPYCLGSRLVAGFEANYMGPGHTHETLHRNGGRMPQGGRRISVSAISGSPVLKRSRVNEPGKQPTKK